MLACKQPRLPRSNTVATDPYPEDYIKKRLPEIRKKVLSLTHLANRNKDNDEKVSKLNAKITILRRERIRIINRVPQSLMMYKSIHDNNILGFEDAISTTVKTIMLSDTFRCFTASKAKAKCQSLTMKGTRCTRNGTSVCGRFCKMHDPATASERVRKIQHNK